MWTSDTFRLPVSIALPAGCSSRREAEAAATAGPVYKNTILGSQFRTPEHDAKSHKMASLHEPSGRKCKVSVTAVQYLWCSVLLLMLDDVCAVAARLLHVLMAICGCPAVSQLRLGTA